MADKIYGPYDSQEALDRAYNARESVQGFDAIIQGWVDASAGTREQLKGHLGLSYGPSGDEVLDVFVPDEAPGPVFLFIHGGYWRMLTKDESSFVAKALTAEGAAVAVNTYSLAPEARIGEIVEQCRRAVVWLYNNVVEHGGDPDRIFVSGHSAGGHLGAMMLATDWTSYGLPADAIKGATLISGIYDMKAMQKAFVNEWLQLTDAEVADYSPMQHPPTTGCPVIVTYGEHDPKGFHEQAAEYRKVLEANGNDVQFLPVPGTHHFSVCEQLMLPETDLFQAVAHQMGLRP